MGLRAIASTLLVLSTVFTLPGATTATPPGPAEVALTPGTLIPSIVCRDRPAQRYALYVPGAATRGAPLPLLLIMDPRGRALIAMEIFQAAAETHGWIAASSWNTASDGPGSVNVEAFNAILPDLQRRIPLDMKRLYLAGFSGTARIAWEFAYGLPGKVAGVIGVGAGLPEGRKPASDPPFVFFGAAGTKDFNYEEVRALEESLARLGFPSQFRYFDGGHQWPEPALGAAAVDWMELMAMKRGLRPKDDAILAAMLQRRADEARSLESKGEQVAAWERWRDLGVDFDGIGDTREPRERATALAGSPAVRQWRSGRKRERAAQISFERRLFNLLAQYQGTQSAPTVRFAVRELQIAALRRQAQSADPDDSAAASRLLSLLSAHASFYVPAELAAAGRHARALEVLELAAAVRENHPGVCFMRARMLAILKREPEAIEALRCWAASPGATRADLDEEEAFASLRALEAFRSFREGLPEREDEAR